MCDTNKCSINAWFSRFHISWHLNVCDLFISFGWTKWMSEWVSVWSAQRCWSFVCLFAAIYTTPRVEWMKALNPCNGQSILQNFWRSQQQLYKLFGQITWKSVNSALHFRIFVSYSIDSNIRAKFCPNFWLIDRPKSQYYWLIYLWFFTIRRVARQLHTRLLYICFIYKIYVDDITFNSKFECHTQKRTNCVCDARARSSRK